MTDFTISGQLGGVAPDPIGENRLLQGLGYPLRAVNEVAVSAYTLEATADAGGGDVASDVNATDFTGQGDPTSTTSYMTIKSADIVNFVHKAILYSYVGPKNVNVGDGGDYTTTASDFAAQGTADHSLLFSLTEPDQHPTSAITGLDAEQAAQDQTFTDHITPATEADPHVQYALKAAALATFAAAGYGGIGIDAATAMADLGPAWATLTGFDTPLVATPKYVTQDYPNNGLRIDTQGVWQVNVKVTMEFNEANGSRKLIFRMYNATKATPSETEHVFFVARNQSGVNIYLTLLADFPLSEVGDLFQMQVTGGVDTYTAVNNIGTTFQVNHISEVQSLSGE